MSRWQNMSFALQPFCRHELLPGDYRVRLHYHPQALLKNRTDFSDTLTAATPEFRVRVSPLSLRLHRVLEVQEMRLWIEELDLDRPPLIVSQCWKPEFDLRGVVFGAEDRLFRAGWKAIPVLLDVLDELPDLSPRKAAWIYALLFDLTGRDRPSSAELGSFLLLPSWPTTAPGGKGNRGNLLGIESAAQANLRSRWLGRRRFLDVEVYD